MMKKQFETPRVVQEVRLQLETNFLGESIVNQDNVVISAGQQVTEIDAGSSEYDWNKQWEWD